MRDSIVGALEDINAQTEPEIDSALSSTSHNAVQNRAVKAALDQKQNTLTFDNTPVSGSGRPVTSGGIYTALQGKQNTLTFDSVPTYGSNRPVTSGGIYTALSGKQNTLVFDSEPTAGSSNPVTSGTVAAALENFHPVDTPDWEQNDDSQPDYIKNRPFYRRHVTETFFDGSVDRMPYGFSASVSTFTRRSEDFETEYFLTEGLDYIIEVDHPRLGQKTWTVTAVMESANSMRLTVSGQIRVYVRRDPETETKYIFFETNYDSAFTANVRREYDIVTKLPSVYIPSPDWEQSAPDGDGYIRNRPFYRTKTQTAVWSGTVTVPNVIYTSGTLRYRSEIQTDVPNLTSGLEYEVTVGDTVYNVTADYYYAAGTPRRTLTFGTFRIENQNGNRLQLFAQTPGDYAISIKRNSYTYTKLSPDYVDYSPAAPNFDGSIYVTSTNVPVDSARVLLACGGYYSHPYLTTVFSYALWNYENWYLDTESKTAGGAINELHDAVNALQRSLTDNDVLNELAETVAKQERRIASMRRQISALRQIVDPNGLLIEVDEDGILTFTGAAAEEEDGILLIDSAAVDVEDGILVTT